MKSVLVTGASSGIGAAAARLLGEHGWRVFGTSRRRRDEPGVHWVALDVRDEASVRAGVAEVLAALAAGRDGEGLDALVCNAGYGIFGSVEETPVERAREQFETNFFGTLRTLRAVLPHLRQRGRGRVVLVGSLSGRAPIPFQAHYSASKAAIEALALALHNEVAPLGIRVSLVEPGDIQTAFNDATDWGEAVSGSAYGARLASCERVIRESLPKAPGPEVVARAIARALESRRPRVRYTVGPDSWAVSLGRRLLPDALALRLLAPHSRV
jgi:NAD(P)-dependent dehydrogenase (short-subunit alcohol dehydrogenase family)